MKATKQDQGEIGIKTYAQTLWNLSTHLFTIVMLVSNDLVEHS